VSPYRHGLIAEEGLDGKIVIVTGATSGVGKETARALARLGATVGLIGRNPDKGRETLAELRRTARHPDRLTFLRCDLASLIEVRALAGQLHERFDKIDVLINNAGVINRRRRVTEDGFEETFAVNHLAHFLLTGLVLDLLQKAAPSRIINVSSDAHVVGRVKLDDLQRTRGYTSFSTYAASKLANLYFTYELARRLEGSGITVNALHPGAVATNFSRNNGALARFAMAALKPFFLTPEQGAEAPIYLATAPQLEAVTGRYFYKKGQIASSRRSRDAATAQALWAASERLVAFTYDPPRS
jgi:NAD(P)-dependent dehydrogenase (short-subunit alcohol dehydrogenase family)